MSSTIIALFWNCLAVIEVTFIDWDVSIVYDSIRLVSIICSTYSWVNAWTGVLWILLTQFGAFQSFVGVAYTLASSNKIKVKSA